MSSTRLPCHRFSLATFSLAYLLFRIEEDYKQGKPALREADVLLRVAPVAPMVELLGAQSLLAAHLFTTALSWRHRAASNWATALPLKNLTLSR